MELVTQYIMRLSMRSSRFQLERPPSFKDIQDGRVHVENFSKMYAAKPKGDWDKAAPSKINNCSEKLHVQEKYYYLPMVSGLVDWM